MKEQYYLNFDKEGNIIGYFVNTINKDIPTSAIKISTELWKVLINSNWKFKTGIDIESIKDLGLDNYTEYIEEEKEQKTVVIEPSPFIVLGELAVRNKIENIRRKNEFEKLFKQTEILGKLMVENKINIMKEGR